ncbi:MAG: peptide chain release factor 2, partial [Rickettsiales bacterium]|nr:peptide chain release factor 2 [Rickettsiales bacterium]
MLEEQANSENIWNDKEKAEEILKTKSSIEYTLNKIEDLQKRLDDSKLLYEMAKEENSQETFKEILKDLQNTQNDFEEFRIENLFSGEADGNDCFIEINTGVGGVDACDFSEMLLNMYIKWCDKKKIKYEIVEINRDSVAGIKSATIKIKTRNAYGLLKNEKGIHRLVRQSPFNSAGKRQTSFTSIDVYPVVDDKINIEILEKDLKIEVCRASGAGGQHVNKTDSAVRILHIPTGIVAECQEQRSQHQNKEEAIKMLKSKLYQIELKKREDVKNQNNLAKGDNGWSSQVRNYVLHPYKLIKDLRTGYETGNTNA